MVVTLALMLLALAALAYWTFQTLCVVWSVQSVRRLEQLDPPEPESWPKLSVIIPACNEADTIEAATRTRLASDYPNLEVILIDDRSDDGTGEIVDRLARDDSRVRAVHITELPDGWLGKVNALHQGAAAATGEWLLFTDADIHVEPDTLRRTIAHCLDESIDFLALIPNMWPGTFPFDCTLGLFVRGFCMAGRIWAVSNPDSTAAIGVGAFNLVRRSAFQRTPGFEHLRLTVVDDLALAQMMKDSGARCRVLNASRGVGLQFYGTWWEAARGTEKSVLIPYQFSYVRLVLANLAILLGEWSPVILLVAGGWLWSAGAERAIPAWLAPTMLAVGAVCLGLALFASLRINHWLRRPLLPAACFPFGAALAAIAMARAAILAARRGGHMWRGVVYPTSVLKAGNRLRFP